MPDHYLVMADALVCLLMLEFGDSVQSTAAPLAHRVHLVQQSSYVVFDEQKHSVASPRTVDEHRRRHAEARDQSQLAKRDQLTVPSVKFATFFGTVPHQVNRRYSEIKAASLCTWHTWSMSPLAWHGMAFGFVSFCAHFTASAFLRGRLVSDAITC